MAGVQRLRSLAREQFYGALRHNVVPAKLLRAAEVLIDRSYLKAFIEGLHADLVLDVGANVGSYAVNLRRLGYAGHICSFEPGPEAFTAMQAQLSADPRWSGMQIALGAQAETRRLHIPRLSNMASFLDPVGEQGEREEIDVRIERLDDVLPPLLERTGGRRVMLKTDTQGYDLEVIKGVEGALDAIVGLQCEISVVPIYENMPHYVEVLGHLESLGFELLNLCTAYRDPRSLRIVEYDCLMARSGELSSG